MNTQEFFDTVERIFHDWHYDHPRILYSLIRALKPRTVVEVGTYRGYAACYMARALQENGMGGLICIDNFSLTDHTARYGDAMRHLLSNLTLCGVADVVTILEGDSNKVVWPERVDFAYIDGWHSYRAVKHDALACFERGATCVCFDDTINCVGPRMLMGELQRGISMITLPHDNGLTICSRIPNLREVTFSQELPNHPGTDLTVLTPEQKAAHFAEAAKHTGLDYRNFTTAPSATAGASSP